MEKEKDIEVLNSVIDYLGISVNQLSAKTICNINSKEAKTGEYSLFVALIWQYVEKILLERENLMVRRIFRLLNRRG